MTIKVTLYPQARLTSACFYLLLPGFFIYLSDLFIKSQCLYFINIYLVKN